MCKGFNYNLGQPWMPSISSNPSLPIIGTETVQHGDDSRHLYQ